MIWDDRDAPLAYLISFRTYGSWLHGDPRGSVSRHRNQYRTAYLPPEENWLTKNKLRQAREEVILNSRQRECVRQAIKDVCSFRGLTLFAVNIRTNHGHVVSSTGGKKPGLLLNAFKANATRAMREQGLWLSDKTPWVDKGSTRYLWNERSIADAAAYVINEQGLDLPEFD